MAPNIDDMSEAQLAQRFLAHSKGEARKEWGAAAGFEEAWARLEADATKAARDNARQFIAERAAERRPGVFQYPSLRNRGQADAPAAPERVSGRFEYPSMKGGAA